MYRENYYYFPSDEVTVDDSHGHIIQARSLSYFLELIFNIKNLEYKLLDMDVEDA